MKDFREMNVREMANVWKKFKLGRKMRRDHFDESDEDWLSVTQREHLIDELIYRLS